MDTFGEKLKGEREKKGLTLDDASKALKIRKVYLQAIEEGNLGILPPVFMRGFIRTYAEFLGLDGAEVLKKEEGSATEEVAEEEFLEHAPSEPKNRRLAFGLVAAAILALAGIIFFIYPEKGRITPEKQEHKPEETSKEVVAKNITSVPPLATITSIPFKAITAPSPQPAAPLKPAPAAKEPKPADGKHHLLVSASELSWLRITIDGKEPFEVLLRPGESVEWTAEKNIAILSGNAGGVDLTFDGKSLGNMGPSGKVVSRSLPEATE